MPYIINKIMHKTKPARIKAPMTIYLYKLLEINNNSKHHT